MFATFIKPNSMWSLCLSPFISLSATNHATVWVQNGISIGSIRIMFIFVIYRYGARWTVMWPIFLSHGVGVGKFESDFQLSSNCAVALNFVRVRVWWIMANYLLSNVVAVVTRHLIAYLFMLMAWDHGFWFVSLLFVPFSLTNLRNMQLSFISITESPLGVQ